MVELASDNEKPAMVFKNLMKQIKKPAQPAFQHIHSALITHFTTLDRFTIPTSDQF
jgi:hypothetical protein